MIVDPVYIVKQPDHITLSVVQVSDNYPKYKEQQVVLDMLSEMTDVVFVFSGMKEIDYKKFTTLHLGCGYVVCDKQTRAENLLGIVTYFKEVYSRHLSYIFMNDWDITHRESFESLQKLQDWNASTIVAPLMTVKRLSEESLANVYVPDYEKTWWGGTKRVYRKGCDYQTHYSTSPFIYLKDIVMKKLLAKDKIEEYAETFVETDPSTMLASLVTDLRIKTLPRYEV